MIQQAKKNPILTSATKSQSKNTKLEQATKDHSTHQQSWPDPDVKPSQDRCTRTLFVPSSVTSQGMSNCRSLVGQPVRNIGFIPSRQGSAHYQYPLLGVSPFQEILDRNSLPLSHRTSLMPRARSHVGSSTTLYNALMLETLKMQAHKSTLRSRDLLGYQVNQSDVPSLNLGFLVPTTSAMEVPGIKSRRSSPLPLLRVPHTSACSSDAVTHDSQDSQNASDKTSPSSPENVKKRKRDDMVIDHRYVFVEGIPLSTEKDKDCLSPRHHFIRTQMVEAFCATEDDILGGKHNKKIHIGQVGIRCVFCSKVPYKERAVRSFCFPSSTTRIYQSVTVMIHHHFNTCSCISEKVRHTLLSLKNKAANGAANTNSKQFWVQSARDLGL
eukprot:555830-Ditylum_brightwellii.AAC.1